MTYTYSLLITDEGDLIIDHELTPDQAVKILSECLNSKPPVAADEKEETIPAVRKRKYTRNAKKSSPRAVAKQGRQPCPECGSSRRHFKHCSFNGKPNKGMQKTELSEGVPMTEKQYDELHGAMFNKSFSSTFVYANQHGIRPREVNAAIKAPNYQTYLETR